MRTSNKKSDTRSYSPLSFLANHPVPKHAYQENIKIKYDQPDIFADRPVANNINGRHYLGYVKPINQLKHWKPGDRRNINHTMIYDSKRNNSFEENLNNLSFVDNSPNKNVSYYTGNLHPPIPEKHLGSIYMKSEHTPIKERKHNVNKGATLPDNPHTLEVLFPPRRENIVRKGGRSPNPLSRKGTEARVGLPQKNKEEPLLFPKIKGRMNMNTKPKDEVRKEKINFMERTYSLTPYKRKRSSNNVSAIENQNYAMKRIDSAPKKPSISQNQGHMNKSKSPIDLRQRRQTEKPTRSKTSQVPLTMESSTQNHSPTNRPIPHRVHHTFIKKDTSSALNSITNSNIQQLQVNGANYNHANSRETLPIPSIHIRRLSERNEKGSANSKKERDITTPKETGAQNLTVDAIYQNTVFSSSFNQTCLTEDQSGHSELLKKEQKSLKTHLCVGEDSKKTNKSAGNIFDSAEMEPKRHNSIVEKKKYKEPDFNSKSAYSFDIEESPAKKNKTRNKKTHKIPIRRQESNENILDEFAENSVQVSIQDQQQSFTYSSTGRGQFDDALETSLISYLDEKGMIRERTKKEIELTLSTTKNPTFKRSRVVVSKAQNSSYDKEHLHVASTAMTNSSVLKNESLLSKCIKDDIFHPDSSLEKNKNLGIDFNFEEELKSLVNKNDLISNQISPSFPSQVDFYQPRVSNTNNRSNKKLPKEDFSENKGVILHTENPVSTPKESERINKTENMTDYGEGSPKAIRASVPKPMYYYANNKLNRFGDINTLEQSFNENPMNSINNNEGFLNVDISNNSLTEKN